MKKFLLKGLKNDGVPKELTNTVYTFEYNDFNRLEYLLKVKKKLGLLKWK